MMFNPAEKEGLLSVKYHSELGFRGIVPDEENPSGCCSRQSLSDWWRSVKDVAHEAWRMGRSDPRKIVYAAKMGLSLMITSLLIFLKEPVQELSRYYVWAILTVVVVFEFSIGVALIDVCGVSCVSPFYLLFHHELVAFYAVGATLSKGFNRGLGTLSAGGLALAMAELSGLAGEWEAVFIVLSIFLIGFCVTYAKLYPTMKPYEYGFRVFLLTYCMIVVSGYRTRKFIHTAVTRFFLIALGASVGMIVNICIYPIWAGEDLHDLVAKNFSGVAKSLEGCVEGYLNCVEYDRVPSKILTYQASDDPVYSGYRSAVESTSQEETLMGFAIWEPPHGRYRMFSYPWKNYVKVSGALRHCAFMVMALHGCILSEIQAPAERRQVFSRELLRVGLEGAKVLRELGNKVKKMEKLGKEDILKEVHEAAEELQEKIDRKSYLLVSAEHWEIGIPENLPGNPQDSVKLEDEDDRHLKYKSLSEAVLDPRLFPVPRSWDGQITSGRAYMDSAVAPPVSMSKNQVSWPARGSFNADSLPEFEESKVYQSASALSLATFASLLIEFVARLQNLVDSFEELSEKAHFKGAEDPTAESEPNGFCSSLLCCFKRSV